MIKKKPNCENVVGPRLRLTSTESIKLRLIPWLSWQNQDQDQESNGIGFDFALCITTFIDPRSS